MMAADVGSVMIQRQKSSLPEPIRNDRQWLHEHPEPIDTPMSGASIARNDAAAKDGSGDSAELQSSHGR
jgi:hypothetical protein